MHMSMSDISREIRRQWRDFRRVNQTPTMLFVDNDTWRTILRDAADYMVTGCEKHGEYWFEGMRMYEVYSEARLIKVVL